MILLSQIGADRYQKFIFKIVLLYILSKWNIHLDDFPAILLFLLNPWELLDILDS